MKLAYSLGDLFSQLPFPLPHLLPTSPAPPHRPAPPTAPHSTSVEGRPGQGMSLYKTHWHILGGAERQGLQRRDGLAVQRASPQPSGFHILTPGEHPQLPQGPRPAAPGLSKCPGSPRVSGSVCSRPCCGSVAEPAAGCAKVVLCLTVLKPLFTCAFNFYLTKE